MMYFDSHAHYYDDRFLQDEENPVDSLLSSLFASSVSHIINIGTSPVTSQAAIEQAQKYPNMYTAVGIHPTDAQDILDLDAALSQIEALIKDPKSKCVAVGEIGLDYHYPDTNKDLQMDIFQKQMALAEKLSLPVVIHDRDAHGDVMDTIARYQNVKGVIHSFSGSAEMAKQALKLGYYISFSGTVTFTNARRVAEAAAVCPPDKILIETDAPYLAPHPLRGSKNHSGNLLYTCRKIAEILNVPEETASKITAENAARLFQIPSITE